jgi:hypothetical protein
LIRDLFHGRQAELSHIVGELDLDNDHRNILAIFGETRVGKSHLALRAVQEVPTGKRGYFHLYVNANQRITTETVLWEAFGYLAEAALSLEGSDPLKDLALQWIADIGKFIRSNTPTVTIRSKRGRVEEAKQSVKVKGEGSIGGTILGFIKAKVGFGIERERSAGESRSEEDEIVITESRPSADHLADIIGFLASVLVQKRYCRRVLFLVDDVDLLTSEVGAEKAEADSLIDALRKLAGLEALTLVATVREDFRERKGKDFRTLCFVDRFPAERDVLHIYHTHVQQLNRGISPYTHEAAAYLAKSAGGLTGRFFDECDRMRQYFTGGDGEWNLDRMFDYYKQEAVRRAGPEFRQALAAIEASAKTGGLMIGGEALATFGLSIDAIKSSPLIGRILHPSRYRPDLFEIDPFVLGALRGRPAEEPR